MKKILTLWLIFLAIVISIYISTETIVPKEFKYIQLNSDLKTKALVFDFKQNPSIDIMVPKLTSVNQFLLTRLEPNFANSKNGSDYVQLYYEVTNKNKETITKQYISKTIQKNTNLLNNHRSKINFPYVYNFKDKELLIKITVRNPLEIDQIKNFSIKIETNNERFLYFFLKLKIFLFLISIYSTYVYWKKYFLQLRQTRTIEQQIILLLGICLILYNMPLNFYLDEVFPNIFFILLSSFINIIFYSIVIYFWLVAF